MTVVRPIVQAEYTAWLEEAVPAYAADEVASGQWSREVARGCQTKEYDASDAQVARDKGAVEAGPKTLIDLLERKGP